MKKEKPEEPEKKENAAPEEANALYEKFVKELHEVYGFTVGTGEFGAHMQVSLVNNGPVTIVLDTEKL